MSSKSSLPFSVQVFSMAMVLGGLIRLMPAFIHDFPINDGGMFASMADQIRDQAFHLPETALYNLAGIPFAYPPLGLFLLAFLTKYLSLSAIEILRWLPAVLSILALLMFYLFASAILKSREAGALATLLYAVTPEVHFWQIMGGGLTRSLGLMFFWAMMTGGVLLFQEEQRWAISLVVMGGALAVLSHPEYGLLAATHGGVMWAIYGRTLKKTMWAGWIAISVVLLTMPWWGTILSRHGPDPFLSAVQTGMYHPNGLEFLRLSFLPATSLPVLPVMRLVGLWQVFSQRRWMLLALPLFPYLVDARAGLELIPFAWSLIAALGLNELWIRWRNWPRVALHRTPLGQILPVLLLVVVSGSEANLRNLQLKQAVVTAPERAATGWIREHIPAGPSFLLFTGQDSPMTDPIQEWFPALTWHHSRTTLQGLEWALGPHFWQRLRDLRRVQRCDNIACLEQWEQETGLQADYLWIARRGDTQAMMASLLASERYSLIFENQDVSIFTRNRNQGLSR